MKRSLPVGNKVREMTTNPKPLYEFVKKEDVEATGNGHPDGLRQLATRLLSERDAYRTIAIRECCPGVTNDMCEEDVDEDARAILTKVVSDGQ
jgi:hypothetical protein